MTEVHPYICRLFEEPKLEPVKFIIDLDLGGFCFDNAKTEWVRPGRPRYRYFIEDDVRDCKVMLLDSDDELEKMDPDLRYKRCWQELDRADGLNQLYLAGFDCSKVAWEQKRTQRTSRRKGFDANPY